MTQILSFPSKFAYAPVRIRSGSKHDLSVRILDKMRPEEARWHHIARALRRAVVFLLLSPG
jgi:hypothetical protein